MYFVSNIVLMPNDDVYTAKNRVSHQFYLEIQMENFKQMELISASKG